MTFRTPVFMAGMLGIALFLSAAANAQARNPSATQDRDDAVLEVAEAVASDATLKDLDVWLRRLRGRFQVSTVGNFQGATPESVMDCAGVGEGPGVQCMTGYDDRSPDPETGFPTAYMFGLDPLALKVNFMRVNSRGVAEGAMGTLSGNTLSLRFGCKIANNVSNVVFCENKLLFHAPPDGEMQIELQIRQRIRPDPRAPVPDILEMPTVITYASLKRLPQTDEAAAEPDSVKVPEPQRQAAIPSTIEALDDVTASAEQERKRQGISREAVRYPDTVTITRNGKTTVTLKPVTAQQTIRFRRQSAARQPTDSIRPPMQLQRDRLTSGGGRRISEATFELAANIDEADGLPALIPFGPRTSLVNIDHVRLRDTERPTQTNVINAINPQNRRCMASVGFADNGDDFTSRYVLLGDRFSDCGSAVRNREGDLFFADSVPERLRQELSEIYAPIYNRFSLKLGSEPAMVFVASRPDSGSNDFRFESSWSRSIVLLFNGEAWQQGIAPQQREALWEEFAMDQILRRLGWRDDPTAFTESAVNYLLMLARWERDHQTVRQLTAVLPDWIDACARDLNRQGRVATSISNLRSLDCGLALQFVYDAAIRAKSAGKDTVHDTWRELLARSFRRNESGVAPEAFISSTDDARRIMQGLLDGSVGLPRFVEELGKLGVRMRMTQDQSGPALEVVALEQFHD